jgi:coenzyme F420-dependent glucose-6-phosphate dehydrogenase
MVTPGIKPGPEKYSPADQREYAVIAEDAGYEAIYVSDQGDRGPQEVLGGAMVPAMYNQKIYTPAMSEENGSVVGSDTLLDAMCISDDPGEHARYAQQFIDLGFTHLFFHAAGPEQARFIRDYAKDALPRIREKNAKVCVPVH